MYCHNFGTIVRVPAYLFFLVSTCYAVMDTNRSVVNIYSNTTEHSARNLHTKQETAYNSLIINTAECDCGPNAVSCWYDSISNKRRCTCRDGYAARTPYWNGNQICVVCNCGLGVSSCKFDDNALKKCECKFGFAVKIDRWSNGQSCEECDCGEGSTACTFSAVGYKNCRCKNGYSEYNEYCKTCNCGEHSTSCYYRGLAKMCNCLYGYEQTSTDDFGTCEECICGIDSRSCEFDNEIKKCTCYSGYANKFGTCTKCYCGPNAKSCEFTAEGKKCTCQPGYAAELHNGDEICKEVTQCDCGPNSYSCQMGYDGYKKCSCKQGYIPKNQNYFTRDEYCENDKTGTVMPILSRQPTGWRIATYISISIFFVIIGALTIYIYRKSRPV